MWRATAVAIRNCAVTSRWIGWTTSASGSSTGTDVAGYLTESPGFSSFVHDDDTVYHAYSTTWRGLEFLMSYYPILDHAPKGRDEGEAWQLWIRRHDEYESE